jgi:hypothetical protein
MDGSENHGANWPRPGSSFYVKFNLYRSKGWWKLTYIVIRKHYIKSLFFKLWVMVLLFLILGCPSIKQLTQSEIGQPISVVIDRWGPPSRVTSDGSGGKIYIWEKWEDLGYGISRLWSLMFWADSNGIVYHWR